MEPTRPEFKKRNCKTCFATRKASFNQSEKAAIAIALAAGRVPNETSKKHFDDLREHFEERQIVRS